MRDEYHGYIELELPSGGKGVYHPDAIALNTGRHAILYHVLAGEYKRVYMPYYICDSVPEMLKKHDINVSYYRIDKQLQPIFSKPISPNDLFLYVNYFGLFDAQAVACVERFEHILLDNSHAFFMPQKSNIPALYSVRKFFGVPDGAYLYSPHKLNQTLEKDDSTERMTPLRMRREHGANAGYTLHKETEASFAHEAIKAMSDQTAEILQQINYTAIKQKRLANFRYMHDALKDLNQLDVPDDVDGPMVYPFLSDDPSLREKLVSKNIYVPHLWPETLDVLDDASSFEHALTHRLLALPIDQRYDAEDMQHILDCLETI